MRSRSGRLTLTHTAILTGLLTLASANAAHAQDKAAAPGAKPAAAAPAAPAAKDAAKKDDKAAAPAAKDAAPAAKDAAKKPAAAAPPAKPLTEKQKKDEAKKAFKEGEDLFGKGEYATALDAYKKADEMLPGLNPKYKIAVSLDKLNKVTDAVAAYQSFLDAVDAQAKTDKKFDPKKYEDKVKESQGRIEALKKTPATVKVAITPDTAQNVQITVDGQPATGKELSLAPGKHTIAFNAEGFETATQDVDVQFAETKELPVQLTEKPKPVAEVAPPPPPPPVETAPAAPPPPPPPPPKSYVPAYVTLGLAGVGAVVGTIFGVSALSAKSQFDKTPTVENADKTDRNALISDMSFAVALTFGVTGAVLLFSGDDKPAEKTAHIIQKPVIAPWASPTGGGATASFRF